MITIDDIYDYVVICSDYENIDDNYWFFKETETIYEKDSLSDLGLNENIINCDERFIKLLRISEMDLFYSFFMNFRNDRLNTYLSLFKKEELMNGIRNVVNRNLELLVESGSIDYYFKSFVESKVVEWCRKNQILFKETIKRPNTYILDDPVLCKAVIIPTDGFLLSSLVNIVSLEDILFDKLTYIVVNEKNVLTLDSQRYAKIPHYSDSLFYHAFLNEINNKRIHAYFENCSDFNISFRHFIDWNHFLVNRFEAFSQNLIKGELIDWCNNNEIKYIDDLQKPFKSYLVNNDSIEFPDISR